MTKYFKNRVLTTYLLNLVLFFSFFPLIAQDSDPPPYLNPNFGPDSISRMRCANDLSTVAEYMKIDLHNYALPVWRKLFDETPQARKNIYIMGAKIYQKLITDSESQEVKEDLFDTLMMIYDRRIEYFGDEGYVLGRKGVDIIRFNQNEFPLAYSTFSKSAELSGQETSLNVITGLVQTGSVMLQKELITTDEFLSKYFLCQNILANKRALGKSIPSIKRAGRMIENVLDKTKFNDCEALETFFAIKISEDETNTDILEMTIDMLTSSGCENSQLYADTNDKLLKISPNAEIAYEVAKYNLKKDNFEKAAEYLVIASEIEDDQQKKALYQHQLSLIYLGKLSSPKEARFYAIEATKSKPDWGEPYLLIAAASIEGISTCGVDAFEKQAIYWLAVDYCVKAKNMDPTITMKANDLITQYKSSFPNVEETFFRSMKEGDEFKFNCWINESTRVKTN